MVLIERALGTEEHPTVDASERRNALDGFATHSPDLLGEDELARIAAARFWGSDPAATDELVAKLMFGVHGRLDRDGLSQVKRQFTAAVMLPKVIFVSLLAAVIWLGCWLTVDVNLTSIHGLYRDRLASAFLVGKDTKGDVDIEDDIDLDDLCRYEARSTAPYHLINVALNLQGSKDPGIRGRQSDFFIFSKRFVGGQRTGYCRSETLEQVFPQMDVATAMAISAAAAAPNMGRATSPFLVAFMTLLNVRLGYWVPNPGLLEETRTRPPGAPARTRGGRRSRRDSRSRRSSPRSCGKSRAAGASAIRRAHGVGSRIATGAASRPSSTGSSASDSRAVAFARRRSTSESPRRCTSAACSTISTTCRPSRAAATWAPASAR